MIQISAGECSSESVDLRVDRFFEMNEVKIFGESVIDFGGFDTPVDSPDALIGQKIKRNLVSTPSMPIAMNLESILTVPNNAWNVPTTPNLFDFVASKVSLTKI